MVVTNLKLTLLKGTYRIDKKQCLLNFRTTSEEEGECHMEWAPFKCLVLNANDSIVKLMVSIASGVSLLLWQRK